MSNFVFYLESNYFKVDPNSKIQTLPFLKTEEQAKSSTSLHSNSYKKKFIRKVG